MVKWCEIRSTHPTFLDQMAGGCHDMAFQGKRIGGETSEDVCLGSVEETEIGALEKVGTERMK